ncbi:MAG: aminopeptidase [Lewinellaceae bacterium]|nr:aminopeptidase [Saprospiraceae bacterium]MCB9340301.1 aminopeptidase [Lewinellaceae bacterium]
MIKHFIFTLFFLASLSPVFAQYQFTMTSDCNCTSIKNQQNTGTCWSFATSSFLESELIRMGKTEYDLSEMYFVRQIYQDKAQNFLLRQGKAQFSQGGLSHDVMHAFTEGGAVPESVYSGKLPGDYVYDHTEMENALQGMLDALAKSKNLTPKWAAAVSGVMDAYMGPVPQKFVYEKKEYTPHTFAASLGIDPSAYLTFTSFTHHPFYQSFVLEIPDNWSNGSYYNVPIGDLVDITSYAISKGYSVAWDGDVSEKGFSAGKGIAILPTDETREDRYTKPGEEVATTQELRQEAFISYSTTDDHLMHITGTAVDQQGTRYFYTKNSWGEISPYQGYVYMSEPYFRLKTVAIMVHKDAVPERIRKKMGI